MSLKILICILLAVCLIMQPGCSMFGFMKDTCMYIYIFNGFKIVDFILLFTFKIRVLFK